MVGKQRQNQDVPGSLAKHYKTLRYINKCKEPTELKAIVNAADKDLICCICECAHNVLNGNVPISKKRIKELSQHQKALASLLEKRGSIKKKKKILIQSGGFLPLLLTPILGIVGSLIGDAIARRGQK